jgi:hypothetical protein
MRQPHLATRVVRRVRPGELSTMKALLAMIVVSMSSVALAQPGAELPRRPDTTDTTTEPGFAVIDKLDASTAAGTDLSYVRVNNGPGVENPTLLRGMVHARYVDAERGLGGYVRVPFAYLRAPGDLGTETTTDVGDIEIGGIYSPRINQPGTGLILHAGITLPTGERGEAGAVGTFANLLALPDVYNSLPRGTTMKLGMSPRFRSGRLFARLDIGLDWNFDSSDAPVGKALHFDAGVGADLESIAVMLESENVTLLSDDMGSASMLNAVAVSARFTAGTASPYLALAVPIDHDISQFLVLAVTAGVEIRP